MTATGQDNPLVSVVMPVHNVAPWVQAAVQSILQQSYSNLELLVVHDCRCTDDTVERVKRVADPRMRLVFSKERGFLPSLAAGIRVARGQWIARMDGDDICHPYRLQRQMAFLNSHPECVFVVTGAGFMTPGGFLVHRWDTKFEWRRLTPSLITGSEYWPDFTGMDAATVFHRDRALDVGLYDMEMPSRETSLWYRLLTKGPACAIGSCCYWQRLRENGLTSDVTRGHTDRIKVRQRYDPGGAKLALRDSVKPAVRTVLLNAYMHRMQICMWAGDRCGALRYVMLTLKSCPFDWRLIRRLLLTVLDLESLSSWNKARSEPQFVPCVPENPSIACLLSKLGAKFPKSNGSYRVLQC